MVATMNNEPKDTRSPQPIAEVAKDAAQRATDAAKGLAQSASAVTQDAVYNFYNEACSACGVLAAPIVTRHLHGCRIICGRGSPPPSVWLGSPVRVPDRAYFFRILVVKDARCVSLRVDASLCLYLGAPPLPG